MKAIATSTRPASARAAAASARRGDLTPVRCLQSVDTAGRRQRPADDAQLFYVHLLRLANRAAVTT